MDIRKTDILIIGGGIAGLMTAYLLSSHKKVTLITKKGLFNSNSVLAQGGIAATISPKDHWQAHFKDTIVAGNHHNITETTEHLVKMGPVIIEQLVSLGVPFDRIYNNGPLSLGKEGGHLRRRIVHAGGDATGKEVIHSLIKHIQQHVDIHENETVIDLIKDQKTCIGAISKNESNQLVITQAENTILATGGIGGLYSITTNDKTITGDGMAMAYRLGARLSDMEFIQFHPTLLAKDGITYGLVSEAVRGEGARLIDNDGNFIMKNLHPLEDLAPRDIVARAIYDHIQKGKQVFLDITMIKNFKERFPSIYKMCKENKINISSGYLPIAPGAHFIMGGIKTNLTGQTSINNLFAIGEVAHTGVHGANRLASNSLLEGAVFANNVAEYILSQPKINVINHRNSVWWKKLNLATKVEHNNLPELKEIQKMMMKYVGIVRDQQGLFTIKKWIEQYLVPFEELQLIHQSTENIKKINMLTVSWLITTSALERTESRGGHYRIDYPNSNDTEWFQKYITRWREKDERTQINLTASTMVY